MSGIEEFGNSLVSSVNKFVSSPKPNNIQNKKDWSAHQQEQMWAALGANGYTNATAAARMNVNNNN